MLELEEKARIFKPLRDYEKPAALFVHMQDNYVDGLMPEEKQTLLSSQKDVINYCNKNRILMVLLQYDAPVTKHLEPILKEIPDNKKIIWAYKGANGFESPELSETLHLLNIRNLLITGINASWCVKATAQGAIDCGFEILTARELIADNYMYRKNCKRLDWFLRNSIYYPDYKLLLE